MKKIINKKVSLIAIIALVIIAIPSIVYGYNYNQYKSSYDKAMSQLNEEKYDGAISGFNNLKSTYFGKKNTKDIKDNIENAKKFKENKKTYDEALKLINEKKYFEAIEILKKIPKDDKKRFELAKKKTEECKTLYIALNIENAKNEAKASKYDSALSYLTLVLNIDSTNKDAAALKAEYTKAKQDAELKAKQEAEEKAKKVAEAKKAEEQKKAAAPTTAGNNIPKERPYRYISGLNTRSNPIVKVTFMSINPLPASYYDRNATVEVIVHSQSGDMHFYGKVEQEIQVHFGPDDDTSIFGPQISYDLIVTDKYGVYNSKGSFF